MTSLAVVSGVLLVTVAAREAPSEGEAPPSATPAKEDLSLPQTKVDVNPVARDEEIRHRLQGVLDATEWFTEPEVRVEISDVTGFKNAWSGPHQGNERDSRRRAASPPAVVASGRAIHPR